MIYSSDRILTAHAGSLPRPDDLREMVLAEARGEPYDQTKLDTRLRSAVAEIVKQQVACGLDVVNDGELSKPNFTDYVSARITGCENRPSTGFRRLSMTARDETKFAEYFAARPRPRYAGGQMMPVCVDKLRYVGQAELSRDLDNFKAALAGVTVAEAFLPANTPGTIEHWMGNEYYESDEAFLFGIAEAMREEYKAIVEAGIVLQIDDPSLPDNWDMINPEPPLEEFKKFERVRIEALNHALRGLPEDRVRYHICWGSWHGPHTTDIPLQDIVDLVLSVNAGAYSVEAGNVRHEHEWRVWQDVPLPEGKLLIPGVVSHATNIVEHPQVVADRIVRYAHVIGRENVIAGTDCGLGGRVHPQIAWAKLSALVEGAKLATRELWG